MTIGVGQEAEIALPGVGNAIIAELLRLSDHVPDEFKLQDKGLQVSQLPFALTSLHT